MITPEEVHEIIENPLATYDDLDELCFRVQNEIGMNSPLVDEILEAISKIIYHE